MLIVEGPDGAGKSTVIQRISREFGLEVAPRACTTEGPVDNLAEWVERDIVQRLHDQKSSVHDRYPLISEMVYGPIMRGQLAKNFDNPVWYGAQIERLSKIAVVVWCIPSPKAVVTNVRNGSKHMSGVSDRIEQIYGGYLGMRSIWPRIMRLHESECQVTWNYETDDFSTLVKELNRMEMGL